MKYKVDPFSNFCRVFRLPRTYSSEYCFNGGHPTNFQMVDWFYPIPQEEVPIAAVSRGVWEKEVGPVPVKLYSADKLTEKLAEFLKEKRYVTPSDRYICICDFGLSFVFDKNGLVTKAEK